MTLPWWEPGAEATVVIEPNGWAHAVPPRKRVALVGFAASTLHRVPWDDSSIELWGLNSGYGHFKRRPDRWFELHRDDARTEPSVPDYFADVAALGCPVYVIETDPALGPLQIPYPLTSVQMIAPTHLRQYLTSTMAYMIALAVHEGFEEIGVYGVDCTVGTEYEAQKPCVEAWLMYAQGAGISVVVPDESALFKATHLYGYQAAKPIPRIFSASEEFIRRRIEDHKAAMEVEHRTEDKCRGAIDEIEDQLVTLAALTNAHRAALRARAAALLDRAEQHAANGYKMQGAIQELEYALTFAESVARGARFPTVMGRLTDG
jgi:hypothetical protein